MFHESFMEEEVSRMFQGCFIIFKGVSRLFQGSFKKKSFMLHGTHHSFPSKRRACFITSGHSGRPRFGIGDNKTMKDKVFGRNFLGFKIEQLFRVQTE